MARTTGLLAVLATAALLACSGCSFGTPAPFSLGDASVDPSYSCPLGATNAAYPVHGTIAARNPTSGAVTISTVSAVMTLATIQGSWLQHVGDQYSASASFTPDRIGAGSNATIDVTIPSACTNPRLANQPVSYGDYSITFTVATSAGTLKVSSKNKHRISTT